MIVKPVCNVSVDYVYDKRVDTFKITDSEGNIVPIVIPGNCDATSETENVVYRELDKIADRIESSFVIEKLPEGTEISADYVKSSSPLVCKHKRFVYNNGLWTEIKRCNYDEETIENKNFKHKTKEIAISFGYFTRIRFYVEEDVGLVCRLQQNHFNKKAKEVSDISFVIIPCISRKESLYRFIDMDNDLYFRIYQNIAGSGFSSSYSVRYIDKDKSEHVVVDNEKRKITLTVNAPFYYQQLFATGFNMILYPYSAILIIKYIDGFDCMVNVYPTVEFYSKELDSTIYYKENKLWYWHHTMSGGTYEVFSKFRSYWIKKKDIKEKNIVISLGKVTPLVKKANEARIINIEEFNKPYYRVETFDKDFSLKLEDAFVIYADEEFDLNTLETLPVFSHYEIVKVVDTEFIKSEETEEGKKYYFKVKLSEEVGILPVKLLRNYVFLVDRDTDYFLVLRSDVKNNYYFHRERSFPLEGEYIEVVTFDKIKKNEEYFTHWCRLDIHYRFDYPGIYNDPYKKYPERRIFSDNGENMPNFFGEMIAVGHRTNQLVSKLSEFLDNPITILPFSHHISFEDFEDMGKDSIAKILPYSFIPNIGKTAVCRPVYISQFFNKKYITIGKIPGLLYLNCKKTYGFHPQLIYVNKNNKVYDEKAYIAILVAKKGDYGIYLVTEEEVSAVDKRFFKVWKA